MPDDNVGLPLDALKEMQPAETPPAPQEEPVPAPEAEQPAMPEAEAPVPESAPKLTRPTPKSIKPAPQTPEQKARYSKADTSKGARRLTYIVLVLLIFVLLFGGLNGYQSFVNIPALKGKIDEANAKIKEASKTLSLMTEEKNTLSSDKDKLLKTKTKLEDDLGARGKEITGLKEDNDTLTRKRTELEGDVTRLTDEKTLVEENLSKMDKDYKKMEEEYKGAVDKTHELESGQDELNRKISDLQKKIDDLTAGQALQQKSSDAKKQEWLAEYTEKYSPVALKMVEQLNQLANALKEGMNYKTYRDMVKELEVPYEEFKMPLTELSYRNPSFKLINSAYNNFKSVEERWKSIVRANPGEEKWRDKIFKLENPVATNRPWADQIQELWREAVASNVMAGLLIESREAFPDKCIVCDGKEKLTCLTCSGNGKCVACTGTGYNKDNAACTFCNASGKCPICLGLMVLPCKICILKNTELGKAAKSEASPAPTAPKEEAPKTTEPPKEEAPKEETPPEHEGH
ncbi:MAG: hypothetical protein HZA49_10025 [Planctomycetes bacterium]|nr:hypothetical protein [Planctomycetota bacterium]